MDVKYNLEKLKKLYSEFGMGLVLIKIILIIYPYTRHNNKIARRLFNIHNKKIMSILEKEYGNLADQWNHVMSEKVSGDTVWTFWWQGIEDAPDGVKHCIRNMERFSGVKKVVVITKDNIHDYIEFPEYIYDKVENGTITFTHFSDLVRMKLLYRYGGLWLDGGVFPINWLDDKIFNVYYWSRKVEKHGEANITDSRWCGSLFAAQAGGVTGFVAEVFNLYWSNHDVQIDYFLIDYLTELAYRHIDEFKTAVDSLPVTNPAFYETERHLNEPKDEYTDIKRIMTENDFLRLQWRKQYTEKDAKGRETVYGYLFKGKDI